MKRLTLYTFTLISFLLSCKTSSRDNNNQTFTQLDTTKPKGIINEDTISENENKEEAEELGTFFIVQVADGYNYDSLETISDQTSKILKSKVDFLGRIFKSNKGIVLPDSCDDDMYCGEYYPRRPFGDQNYISIEMNYAFEENKSWDKRDTLKMIVVANIFEDKKSADSVVHILQTKIKSATTNKQELYLGCMH